MTFDNPLNPGDVMVIDTDTAEVMINSQEVFQFSGSLFYLSAGGNTLTYTDSEGSRDLNIDVVYVERYA